MVYRFILYQVAFEIPHGKVYLHYNITVFIIAESHRFYMRIDHMPLPHPVIVHGLVPVQITSFEAIGPVDIGVHTSECGFYVAGIECLIGAEK